MTVIKKWSGTGAPMGALDGSAVGPDDDPFDIFTGGDYSVVAQGAPQLPRRRILMTHQSGDACYFGWSFTAQNEGSGRVHFTTPSAWPSASHSLVAVLVDGSTTAMRIDLAGAGAPGQLRLRDSSSQLDATGTNVLSLASSYRVEWTLDQVSGDAEVRLYEGSYTVPIATLSGSGSFGSDHSRVVFGNVNATPIAGACYMDDLAVSDAVEWLGAINPVDPPEPSSIIRRWNGEGLSAGTLNISSAGYGDNPFEHVQGSPAIVAEGLRSPAIRLPNEAAVKRFGWWPLPDSPVSTYAVRFYLTMDSTPTSEIYLANGINSGTGAWSIRLSASGHLRLRDDAGAAVRWTAPSAWQPGTRTRVELVVNSGTASLRAYVGDTDILLWGVSGMTVGSAINEVRFGSSSSVATNNFLYDEMALSTDAVEIGPTFPPGTPVTWFFFDGSDWLPTDPEMVSV